jgi:hypothetical protein
LTTIIDIGSGEVNLTARPQIFAAGTLLAANDTNEKCQRGFTSIPPIRYPDIRAGMA